MKIDKELLEDIKDTLEHIVDSEVWETLEETSSAKELIKKIDKVIKPTDDQLKCYENISTIWDVIGVSKLLTNIKLKILGGINYV